MSIKTYTRIDELKAERARARLRVTAVKKELRSAQQKMDRADQTLLDIEYEIDLETIESWGRTPDLAALLDAKRTMAFYRALGALAQRWGFHIGGQRTDTGQVALSFAMDRGEIGGVERVAEGIRYFARGMKSSSGRGQCFNLVTNEENCAYELAYRKRSDKAAVIRMAYGRDTDRKEFDSLEDALRHIESNLWCENIIDIGGAPVLDGPVEA